MMNKVCQDCGKPLPEGAHFNILRCPDCRWERAREYDLKRRGTVLQDDDMVCPACGKRFRLLTAQHILTHGFSVPDFKKEFGLIRLKPESACLKHSVRMRAVNPRSGNPHTAAAIAKMKTNRRGKGVGRCGKYERTPEIRARIAEGVADFQTTHPGHGNKFFKGGLVFSEKADQKVWIRSSWERRVLWVLDQQDGVEEIQVEPFHVPYLFEGVWRRYIPDLLITFEGGIQEIWEIKPDVLIDLPKNQAKFNALNAFAAAQGMSFRVVTLADIERMECKTFVDVALREPAGGFSGLALATFR